MAVDFTDTKPGPFRSTSLEAPLHWGQLMAACRAHKRFCNLNLQNISCLSNPHNTIIIFVVTIYAELIDVLVWLL